MKLIDKFMLLLFEILLRKSRFFKYNNESLSHKRKVTSKKKL